MLSFVFSHVTDIVTAITSVVLLVNTLWTRKSKDTSRGSLVQAAIAQALGQIKNMIAGGILKPGQAADQYFGIISAVLAAASQGALSEAEKANANQALASLTMRPSSTLTPPLGAPQVK